MIREVTGPRATWTIRWQNNNNRIEGIGMIEEVRKKALEHKKLVDNDVNASEIERETANDIVLFLGNEADFHRVTRGTFFNIFAYIGFEIDIQQYEKMYDQLMKEADEVFTYVDPEYFKKN